MLSTSQQHLVANAGASKPVLANLNAVNVSRFHSSSCSNGKAMAAAPCIAVSLMQPWWIYVSLVFLHQMAVTPGRSIVSEILRLAYKSEHGAHTLTRSDRFRPAVVLV